MVHRLFACPGAHERYWERGRLVWVVQPTLVLARLRPYTWRRMLGKI